eukprot:GHVU01094196.1.p1 GENE.GHVU01094196.1~~GHVU01094196.1.p1  ORF type:complete len:320 (+),score=46.71 GHVU01094196.1:412-1371(+)
MLQRARQAGGPMSEIKERRRDGWEDNYICIMVEFQSMWEGGEGRRLTKLKIRRDIQRPMIIFKGKALATGANRFRNLAPWQRRALAERRDVHEASRQTTRIGRRRRRNTNQRRDREEEEDEDTGEDDEDEDGVDGRQNRFVWPPRRSELGLVRLGKESSWIHVGETHKKGEGGQKIKIREGEETPRLIFKGNNLSKGRRTFRPLMRRETQNGRRNTTRMMKGPDLLTGDMQAWIGSEDIRIETEANFDSGTSRTIASKNLIDRVRERQTIPTESIKPTRFWLADSDKYLRAEEKVWMDVRVQTTETRVLVLKKHFVSTS